MSLQAALAPLFVQVALTFGLLLWLAPLRTRALNGKEVAVAATSRSAQKAWPQRSQQIANCFQNQFELPVLFYILVILAIIARKDDLLFVIMSWLFVVSRLRTRLHPHGLECREGARSRLWVGSPHSHRHVDHIRRTRASWLTASFGASRHVMPS